MVNQFLEKYYKKALQREKQNENSPDICDLIEQCWPDKIEIELLLEEPLTILIKFLIPASKFYWSHTTATTVCNTIEWVANGIKMRVGIAETILHEQKFPALTVRLRTTHYPHYPNLNQESLHLVIDLDESSFPEIQQTRITTTLPLDPEENNEPEEDLLTEIAFSRAPPNKQLLN